MAVSKPKRSTYYSEYVIKWAHLTWEEQQAKALRRRVFCEEQALFTDDDQDSIDPYAQTLVAVGVMAGWHEHVVGCVRIHQAEAGTWYGSRLAVDSAFRCEGHLGPALIKLAVSSAQALGCQRFLAHVQTQNEPLFKRLRWQRIGHERINGKQHILMAADLNHYPAHHTPYSGVAVRGCNRPTPITLAPDYLPANPCPAEHLSNNPLVQRY